MSAGQGRSRKQRLKKSFLVKCESHEQGAVRLRGSLGASGGLKDPYEGGPKQWRLGVPHPGEQVTVAGVARNLRSREEAQMQQAPRARGLWVINRSRPPHRRKELWVRVQAAAEAREKKATRRKGLWVRDRGRAAGRGPSAQRTLGKGCRKVRWRRKEARPRGKDWGPPQGVVGSSSAPGKATQSHSPAARRPPRPGDGPGARGGCGGPSAVGTPALASIPAAPASVCLRRPPSARTRPLLTSPRGLGSRQGQGVEQTSNPSAVRVAHAPRD